MKNNVVFAIVAGLWVSSCSLLVPHTQNVTATCSEPDAKLFINQEVFTGFGATRAPKNKILSVMCTKEGYKPATVMVGTTVSGVGLFDVITTTMFFVPPFGLLSPGSWKLEYSNVHVPMEKLPSCRGQLNLDGL